MLCKVDNGTVSGKSLEHKTSDVYSASGTYTSETTWLEYTETGILIWYKLHIITATSWGGACVRVYLNGTKVTEYFDTANKYSEYYTWPNTANNVVKVTGSNNGTKPATMTYEYIYDVFWDINISKTIFTHKCLPRQLKEIGNKALGTLFGMHIDNTRYNVENE